MSDKEYDNNDALIAVVGMACHLPGARNIEQYWNNLSSGVESVHFFSDEELLQAGESPELIAHPDYVKAQPTLKGFDLFDAKFWGFSPQEAAVTDPAHRVFLEVAYHALEHSGHTGYDEEGTVAVFATAGASMYWRDNLSSNAVLMEEMGEFLVRHTGNDMNFLATRLSYELDFRGPSMNIQTACSSSLVAIHTAVQSLLGGECDMAVAGGSTVLLPQQRGYLYKEGEILSPDGHCRPFDANSAGTVFGSGSGAIVLKRLEDAQQDGDTVYALIHGSAINNDGAQKIGYLAPGVEGQAGVISEALDIGGIKPEQVGYVEAHGTGTMVGDPIEFDALNQVFRESTDQCGYCRLGSVKSNIGHLGEAAGAAAMIKVILSLQHKKIPPTINYQSPNPNIDLEASPFVINTELDDWAVSSGPRFAGVTALGAGGTNAHIVLSEAPEQDNQLSHSDNKDHELLVLSAKTPNALNAACRQLASYLSVEQAFSQFSLRDIAHTLQYGRRHYACRRAVPATCIDQAIQGLEDAAIQSAQLAQALEQTPKVVFMFSGGGAQYAGMGLDLYREQPVYCDAIDQALSSLDDADLAKEIKTLIYDFKGDAKTASKALERPSRALPALLATEYALARQLMAWGITADAMVGHSMGEYTAACLAGVMSLSQAMNLVALRGRLFEGVPSGGMLSVALPQEKVRELLLEGLDIAAVNAPDLCVASGPVDLIESFQSQLEASDVECTRVHIDVAAHSRMLDDILSEFEAYCRTLTFKKPQLPFASNFTGTWITDEQATDPVYWVRHLRNTVLFDENLRTLCTDSDSILLEVGPGRVLSSLAKASVTEGAIKPAAIINVMRHITDEQSDTHFALAAVGEAWSTGADIDFLKMVGNVAGRRVPLPGYPFERQSYWVEPSQTTPVGKVIDNSDKLLKRSALDSWFSQLRWQQLGLPQSGLPQLGLSESESHGALSEDAVTDHSKWLIFRDSVGLSENIADALVKVLGDNATVTWVDEGKDYKPPATNTSEPCFQLPALDPESFERLFNDLAAKGEIPSHIVYAWSITDINTTESMVGGACPIHYEKALENYFWRLFYLVKALSAVDESVQLTVLSTDMYGLAGGAGCPEKMLQIGPVAVLPREFNHLKTQLLDVSSSDLSNDRLPFCAQQLLKEITAESEHRFVAYRGGQRWAQKIVSEPLLSIDQNMQSVAGSTVLISGGLGGIGLCVADYFAGQGAGKIILLGRKSLPERSDWAQWLAEHVDDDATCQRIVAVQKIEEKGADVISVAANIADGEAVKRALAATNIALKHVTGVVHAAGTLDDQVIPLKTNESVTGIIDAKVKGALVLDSLFSNDQLDFFVMFSSVASFLGLPGQVDYTSANAFLDGFAVERASRSAGNTVVINWNAWRDVGMAANQWYVNQKGYAASGEKVLVRHPALDYRISFRDDACLLIKDLNVEDQWILSEHRVKDGHALIPGTGLVELFRAAFIEAHTHSPTEQYVELSDIQFFAAFEVDDEKSRTVCIEIDGNSTHATLTLYSENVEMPHAVCTALLQSNTSGSGASIPALKLVDLKEKNSIAMPVRGKFLDQNFMDFGLRWACIEDIGKHASEPTALLKLSLDASLQDDLKDYLFHPGLMDMATGAAQFLIDGFSQQHDFYVPVGYQKIAIYNGLTDTAYSYVRLQEGAATGFAQFDVTVCDSDGDVLVDITGFTMRKVEPGFGSDSGDRSVDTGFTSVDALSEVLEQAIVPTEGIEAFSRVMQSVQQNASSSAQWIVSSVDPECWARQLDDEPSGVDTSSISYIKESQHDPDADDDISMIETALQAHLAIERTVVRSFLDESGERRLIAYYVVDWSQSTTVSELRQYMKDQLSLELVPQQFIEHDELPCNAAGEPDRSLLDDPLAPKDTYIAPTTATEKTLAKIWQAALGADKISQNENFYDAGGHSLLAIRVIIKIEKQFGVRIEQALMAMQTLEQIAKDIDLRKPGADVTDVSSSHTGSATMNTDKPLTNTKSDADKKSSGILKSLFGKK